jgi:hypothetical protein
MFWRPDYLQGISAWVDHLPFAFWIVEALQPSLFVELGTHYGHSYFSFCQAIKRLGLNTPSYAVDTWKGDDQAGHYEEGVYQQVESYNQANYPEFSSLLRCTFDEALSRFNDGTIDLLHIDGFHTYEAVRHDFESWLPKLSDRAVVLFHDTNVRRDLFGVHKYFAELAGRYPSFEFIHGHGLGVLGVGKDQPELLRSLYTCYAHQPSRNIVYELFSRLGRSCHDLMDLNGERTEIQRVREESHARANHITHLEQVAGERGAEIERLNGELARLNEESGAKASHVAHLEQVAGERGAEIERLNGEIARLNEESGAKASHVAHLEQVAGERGAEIEQLEEELSEKSEMLDRYIQESAQMARLTGAGEAEKESKNTEIEKIHSELAIIQVESQARADHIVHLEQEAAGRVVEIERLNGELSEKSEFLDCYIQESAQMARMIIEAQEERDEWRRMTVTAEIEEVIQGSSHETGEHQHINYMLKDISHLGRKFSRLDVRIVEHHGNPGVAIMKPIAEERPFYAWEKHGEENGQDYMLIIPTSKNGNDWLERATTNDLLLYKDIVSYAAVKIKQNGANKNWADACRSILISLRGLSKRVHYDDIKLENKIGTYNVRIINASLGGDMLHHDMVIYKKGKVVEIKGKFVKTAAITEYYKGIYQREYVNITHHF